MSKGTLFQINRATARPILMAGVERRLFSVNLLIHLPLAMAIGINWMNILILLSFVIFHLLLREVTNYDPVFSLVFKRATRYLKQQYYPAKSSVCSEANRPIKTVDY